MYYNYDSNKFDDIQVVHLPGNPIKHIAIAKYFQNPNFVKEVEKYS